MLAAYDSGLEMDKDCRTGDMVYVVKGKRYSDRHFLNECVDVFMEREMLFNNLATELQVFDCDFWSNHTLSIVPIKTPLDVLFSDMDARLDFADCKFWSKHKLSVVPIKTPSFWMQIWNCFIGFFMRVWNSFVRIIKP